MVLRPCVGTFVCFEWLYVVTRRYACPYFVGVTQWYVLCYAQDPTHNDTHTHKTHRHLTCTLAHLRTHTDSHTKAEHTQTHAPLQGHCVRHGDNVAGPNTTTAAPAAIPAAAITTTTATTTTTTTTTSRSTLSSSTTSLSVQKRP